VAFDLRSRACHGRSLKKNGHGFSRRYTDSSYPRRSVRIRGRAFSGQLPKLVFGEYFLPGTFILVHPLHRGLNPVGSPRIPQPDDAKARFNTAILHQDQVAAAELLLEAHQQRATPADVVGDGELGEPPAALVHCPDAHRQIFDQARLARSFHRKKVVVTPTSLGRRLSPVALDPAFRLSANEIKNFR
jgi:hypothetical protein